MLISIKSKNDFPKKLIMKIKEYLLIILIIFSCSVSFSQNKPYINPTPEEISIMAITPFPEGVTPTKEGYEIIQDCGFNLVCARGDVNYFKNQFQLMGDLKLKYLVSANSLRTNEKDKYINELKNNKHLGGWVFIDEPFYEDLPTLAVKYNELWDADPDHLIYMNLVGQMVKKFVGPYKEYAQYLNYIQKLFYPPVWSFDLYPIYKEKNKFGVFYDMLYEDMEAMHKISDITERPFWAFCLGMGYKAGGREFPSPTTAYLRFEAFTALAYGAQGIVYWSYAQRISTDSETYMGALVDLKGNKTSAWTAAKTVNQEIKKYNDVFYKCKVKEVRHTGDKIYTSTKKLSGKFGPLKMVRSGNAGVLVSMIENNGDEYVVIVNHDVFKKQKITLELEANKEVQLISIPNAPIYSWRKDINVTLDKGGYVILKVIE